MATLEVEVIRAQGLVASDLNGKSDPYVKLLVGKRKKTTKTVYKSLNPHWNEVFQFAVLHPDREVLRIEVWDKDSFSRDDFMGRTHVALNSLIRSERGEKWLTLHGGTGSILVALRAINFGIPPGQRESLLSLSPPFVRDTVRVLCVKASSGAIPMYRLTDYDDIGLTELKPLVLLVDTGLERVLDLYCAGDHEEGVTITEVFRTVAGDELATVVHNSGSLTGGIRNEVALPPFTVEHSTFRLGTYLWSITVEGTSFTSFSAQYFVNVLKAKKIKHIQPQLALLHSLAPFNRPIVMGPVLQFRGMHCRPQYTNPVRDISLSQSIDMTIKDVLDSFDSDAECPMYHCVAALVVTKHVKGIEAEPALEVSDCSCAVHRHLLYGITEGEGDDAFEAKLWCFEWGIEVAQEEQRVAYRVAMDGEEHRYHYYIPARDRPPSMTATSCNGFDNEENRGVVGLNVENVWRTMLERHMSTPFHLILQGGDQIYADGMIPRIPLLKGWEPRFPLELDVNDPAVEKTFKNIYFRMYCEHWGLPVQRDVFAHIPSCMIWDDHDIFDGWGSYRSTVQDTPSYRFIFKHATEAFSFFQLGMPPDARQPANLPHQHGYTYAHIVGPVCILNLDLRFERSLTSVFSEHSLDGVFQYLEALRERNELLERGKRDPMGAGGVPLQHLIVVSSICVMYGDFSSLEAAMETVPEVLNLDPMELEDDLKDHWRSPCHKAERLIILHKLFSFAAAAKCRVTIVSGDVHLAALGVLENTAPEYASSNARSIVQVITSPVMNLPTHGSSLKLTETVCGGVEKLDEHVVGKMVRMPGKSSKVVSARNYVEMKMEHESNAISVRFILENDPMQPSVDIAPYSETEPLEFVIDQ